MRTTRMMSLVLALLLFAVPLAWIGTFTDLDLALADAMFDPAAKSFPWRHAWITERFGHGFLKHLFAGIGVIVMAACLWDSVSPRRRWPRWWTLRLRVVALSAGLTPLAISALKRASASHCPWDLARYGGTYPYIRLLEAMPAGIPAGHCMPGGHASSALWLVSFAVLWLPHRPRTATGVACALLVPGFILGWVQQLRGAHFLTHTLWSMWFACAIACVLYVLIVPPVPRVSDLRPGQP